MPTTSEINLIDKTIVDDCCTTLQKFLDGKKGEEDCLRAIDTLEYKYRFANEKTRRLKSLLHQKNISDIGQWRSEILANIWAIKDLAAIQNQLIHEHSEKRKHFRVELRDPINLGVSPLTFRALIYIEDTYTVESNGSVSKLK